MREIKFFLWLEIIRMYVVAAPEGNNVMNTWRTRLRMKLVLIKAENFEKKLNPW
jgi:hypothetical protein